MALQCTAGRGRTTQTAAQVASPLGEMHEGRLRRVQLFLAEATHFHRLVAGFFTSQLLGVRPTPHTRSSARAAHPAPHLHPAPGLGRKVRARADLRLGWMERLGLGATLGVRRIDSTSRGGGEHRLQLGLGLGCGTADAPQP